MKETFLRWALIAMYYLVVTPAGLLRQLRGGVGSRAWVRGCRGRGGWREVNIDSHDKSIYLGDA